SVTAGAVLFVNHLAAGDLRRVELEGVDRGLEVPLYPLSNLAHVPPVHGDAVASDAHDGAEVARLDVARVAVVVVCSAKGVALVPNRGKVQGRKRAVVRIAEELEAKGGEGVESPHAV